MNFKTNKFSVLPIIPNDPNRKDFDSSIVRVIEENTFNTKDDLILIAKAFDDLINCLIDNGAVIASTGMTELMVTSNMNDLRNQK